MARRRTVPEAVAWTWVRRAREVRVAAVVDGAPMLRTMHAAVLGRRLVLHGAPKGSKARWLGAPVVAAAEDVVARVPSWMRHPERACPATTYYRSVQVTGRIGVLDDPELRAAGLQALMEALQPEGGYRPLTPDDPLYAKTIEGLGMWAIEVDEVSAVAKLGQHLREDEMARVLQGLWQRGGPGDLEAIGTLTEAHPGTPTFRSLPDDLVACCVPTECRVEQVMTWLPTTYWNIDVPPDAIRRAHHQGAWVGIEEDGRLVASARAISDRHKRAWLYDVIVDPARRRTGLGTHLIKLLLDHPLVRHAYSQQLVTRDADAFYATLGFRTVHSWGSGPNRRVTMTRRRPVDLLRP